jgi:secreted trypsin-like serine protease
MFLKRLTAVLLSAGVALGSLAVGAPAQAIVGGHEVPLAYTFLAHVTTGNASCSGVLIKAKWVATARHCKTSTSTTRVRVGNIDRTKGTLRSVVRVIPHDVADLKLLELDATVNHIPIPIADSPTFVPNGLYAVGWGRTCLVQSQCPNLPTVAREFFVQVVAEIPGSGARCYENLANPFDTNNEMCVFNHSSGQYGTCKGDSGGPIIDEVTETSWRVVGIVARGVFDDCAGTHTIATDLYFQRDWIRSHIGSLPT